jgi:hypothetical protein
LAKRFSQLNSELIEFISQQKMFFVATAATEGRVNLSPKGMDSLRVLDANTVAWLNLTGSGNETAAHVLEDGRMTIMFCAFEGRPLILRLYGRAQVYHARDNDWEAYAGLFKMLPGARQIFVLSIDLVQTSCGLGVPLLDYQGERGKLIQWAEHRGPHGIAEYWERKNQLSLDGKPTGIFTENELKNMAQE